MRAGGFERRRVVGGHPRPLREISFPLICTALLVSVTFVVLFGTPTFSVLLNAVYERCRNLLGR